MSIPFYERHPDGTRTIKTLAETSEVINPSGTNMTHVVETSVGYLASNDIHNNGGVVQFASHQLDPNWSRSNNTFTYAGSPDVVEITVNISAGDTGVSNYWGRPALRISNSTGTVLGEMDDLAMQQNGAYSGDVQITGVVVIKSPTDLSFIFEWFDRDNRTSTLTPIPSSHVALKAKTKAEVYTV